MTYPSASRYGGTTITLHWLTLALIVAVYATMELREFWPKGSETREAMKAWHYTLGLTVLALALGRILAHVRGTIPPIVPAPPGWQTALAKVMHVALYAFLIAMPIAGWLILSAEGDPIPFWGFELPALMAPGETYEDLLEEVHETGGKIGYALIGLHAVAALFHHYVVRDNTLARMLPGRRLG